MMNHKLLIIDELSPYLFFIKRFLLNESYQVTALDTEKEILELVNKNEYDLILIDVQMNKGEGLEILKRLKMEFQISAPIIVISAVKHINEIEKAFDYGAYDYLIKPLNLRDLKNKLSNALEKDKLKKGHHV
ncbi:MAG TPA: hypothetical protein DCG75_18365 [Bacteroidales bacterium]|nr:hypothetical protein [Bacteroidales bacterium]